MAIWIPMLAGALVAGTALAHPPKPQAPVEGEAARKTPSDATAQTSSVEILAAEVKTLLAKQQHEQALGLVDSALAQQPKNAQLHCLRATCFGRSKQHESAIESATIAIELDETAATAYGERAFNLYSLGRYKKALADYDRFVALEPTSYAGHGERGDVLLELDRPREAMRAFDRALKIAPGWPNAHSQRGSAARQIGDLEEARLSFGRAVALNGEDRYSAQQFTEVLFEMGRGHRALTMTRSLARDLKSYWHLMLRGRLAMRLGKLDVAARDLQKAAERGDPLVQVDAKLLLGCVFLATGDFDNAADTFRHELPESLASYRPWLALMLWCAETRAKSVGAADRLRTATSDASDGIRTLVALCVDADPPQLPTAGLGRGTPDAACLQFFFAGWRALARGDNAGANDLLLACINTGAKELPQWRLARVLRSQQVPQPPRVGLGADLAIQQRKGALIAVVTSVHQTPLGAAALQGLQPGDAILRIAHTDYDANSVHEQLAAMPVGRELCLTVLRGEQEHVLHIRLGWLAPH